MKVQSTGLGKTVMEAKLTGMAGADFEGESVLLMTMESFKPLHWTIKVHMEPADVRHAILMGLRPSLAWKALMALFFRRYTLLPRSGGRPPETESPDAGEAAAIRVFENRSEPATEKPATEKPVMDKPRTGLPGILAHPGDSAVPGGVASRERGGAVGAVPPPAPLKKGRLPGVLAHPEDDEDPPVSA